MRYKKDKELVGGAHPTRLLNQGKQMRQQRLTQSIGYAWSRLKAFKNAVFHIHMYPHILIIIAIFICFFLDIFPSKAAILLSVFVYFSYYYFSKIFPNIINIGAAAPEERPKLWINIAKLFIQSFLIVSILAGILATIRTIENNRATLENDRMDRVTERFFKAVDALSNEDNYGTKRMSGIFTLQQIATSDKDFKMPVIWVLTNFINERCPWPEQHDTKPDCIKLKRNRTISDIQAVLNALNDIKKHYKKVEKKDKIDVLLWNTDLSGSFFEYHQLEHVRFSGSNLTGSKMKKAILNGATFGHYKRAGGKILEPAILKGVDLEGAELVGAQLEGVDLEGARLEGVDLSQTIGLKPDQLGKSCIDAKTIFPEGAEFEKVKKKRIEELKKEKDKKENEKECPSKKS